jgi:hypothetical protein
MELEMRTMKRVGVTMAMLGAFAAGVAAQRVAGSVTMQGTVRDANTLAEEIEYWEVRGTAGETIVITGRKDVPLIQWLRQAKNRPVRLTAGPSDQAASE